MSLILLHKSYQNFHTTRSQSSTTESEDAETDKNLRKVNPVIILCGVDQGIIRGFVSYRDFDICIALHSSILLFYPDDGENDKGKDHWDLLAPTPFRTVAI